MSVYTVYRTTNVTNGMFYIGVHKTQNLNDGYLGSGKRLKYAIQKYGVESFKKEILHVFENANEAYSKEKELVTEEVLDSGKCYNLKIGGEGGWDYANKNYSQLIRLSNLDKMHKFCNLNLGFIERRKIRSSNLMKRLLGDGRVKAPDWTGKLHREETKHKIGEANSKTQLGSKNSQFGSKWITDGISNKKIKKDQDIPNGWRCGRKIKNQIS